MPLFTKIISDSDHNNIIYQSLTGQTVAKAGGSLSWRNNNPGNIRSGAFADSHGAIGSNKGFAVFPDEDTGRKALGDLLNSKDYQSLSVGDAIKKYAPPSENDTGAYTKNVESISGIKADQPMSALTPDQKEQLINAVQKIEGWKEGDTTPQPADGAGSGGSGSNSKDGGGPVQGSTSESQPSTQSMANAFGNDVLGRPVSDISEAEINTLMGTDAYWNSVNPNNRATRQKVADWYDYHYGNEAMETDATGQPIAPAKKASSSGGSGEVSVQAYTRDGGKVSVSAYARSSPHGQ